MPAEDISEVQFALPKGRMYESIVRLLDEAGVGLRSTARNYRPAISLSGLRVKILKPRAVVEMLGTGQRDLGFAGADWVREDGADLVELLDTGLDRVRLVAAVPQSLRIDGDLPARTLVVASEYERLTKRWIEERGIDARFVRSYGATEVLPPDDADCIVDNTATGSTLEANNLEIIDEIMTSSTRLYASRSAMHDPAKRERIEQFAMLVASVIEARRRVMVELNVSPDRLDSVISILPCMRRPTVSPLHGADGFAVKIAALRKELPSVIPQIKARGGTDIVVTNPIQIVS